MIKFFYIVVFILIGAIRIARADMYDVAGIPIAAEDSSAQAARTVAIQNGETAAFQDLMNKMLTTEHKDGLVMPGEADIIDMVQNVSLNNEKYTATKYMADLTVRFNPQKIQTFLKAQHIPYLTEELPVTVVIPVWHETERIISPQEERPLYAARIRVLEEDNPVYAYLNSAENPADIRIPVGDLEEMARAAALIDGTDPEAAEFLRLKYGAGQVMILEVKPDETGQKYATARFIPDDKSFEADLRPIPVSGTIDGRVDIGEFWTEILNQRELAWRNAKTEDLNLPDLFWIRVPIRRLADWVAIQKKLNKAFENIQIYGFRPNTVLLGVPHKGTAGALQREMNRIGFDLTADESMDVWILRERKETDETGTF